MEMGFNESLSRGQVCVYWEKEKIIITARNKIIIIVPFFYSEFQYSEGGSRATGKKNNQPPKRAYNCIEKYYYVYTQLL